MNNPQAQITRIGSYGVITEGGSILLCRLSEQATTHRGMWTLPGGGLEFGEHPEAGMVREVMEETGLEVTPGGLLGVNSITRLRSEDAFQSIQIVYSATCVGGSLRHEVDGTTDLCEWHPIEVVQDLEIVGLVKFALGKLPDPR